MLIRHAILEPRIAEIVLAGREDGVGADNLHRAVVAVEGAGDVEAVAFHIRVIGDQFGQRDDEGGVLVRQITAFILHDGRIVHRRDIVDDRTGRNLPTIGDLIGEGRLTVPVEIGQQLDVAIRQVEEPDALAGGGHPHEGRRIVGLIIVVVGEKLGAGDDQRRILEPVENVGDRHRGLVCRRDVDGDAAHVLAVAAIGDDIVEAGDAVPVVLRGEDDLAFHNLDRSVHRSEDGGDGQRIAIHVEVV